MLPEQQSPLILRALTLRGIGSYISGARLEIKPLTILCGANGSGKSTWLKALNVLEKSLTENLLPYGFAINDWNPQDIQLTNALYHLIGGAANLHNLDEEQEAHSFGVPGTIGLEFQAARDLYIGENPSSDVDAGIASNFLQRGFCPKGTEFVVRLAHPTYWDDTESTPNLRHNIELRINGHVLRMSGERDPLQKFERGLAHPRRSKPYTLSCSRSFLPNVAGITKDIVDLATITDLNLPRFDVVQGDVTSANAASILSLFEKRLLQLLKLVLNGYFYIGAIRQLHNSVEITPETPESRRYLDRRHVGSAGEFAWQLDRRHGTHKMRRITSACYEVGDFKAHSCLLAFGEKSRNENPKLARIWELADLNARSQLDAFQGETEIAENVISQPCVDLLNSVLDRRELFDCDLWVEQNELPDGDGRTEIQEFYPDPEIEALVNSGIDSLNDDDVRRLNYLLICDALSNSLWHASSQQCEFDDYLSSWLTLVADVQVHSQKIKPPSIGQWTMNISTLLPQPKRPTPFLLASYGGPDWNNGEGMSRLSHRCFGAGLFSSNQPPRQLSAGFHQLFPVIVQMGLMREGELVGIENPEVHLHPSLQMKVTEMLLEHAASGRRIIVETHSDLVIRRVIRAVLEESIGQSQIAIYFVGLSDEVPTQWQVTINDDKTDAKSGQSLKTVFYGSRLEPIRMDDRGRIANWPVGFLDDDVREAQRLMDVMYGEPSQEEEEDE